MTPNEPTDYYFALLRLGGKFLGKNARRSEGTWAEAHFAGVAVYLVSYLFAAHLLLPFLSSWSIAPAMFALLFALWFFWLIVLYLNSLIVRLCWSWGLFKDLSANRIQSVLVGILTSVFAAELMVAGRWTRWIGIAWIVAVMLNLSAALLLALNEEESS